MYLIEAFPNDVALKQALSCSKDYGQLHENKSEDYGYCLLRERGNELRTAQKLGIATVVEFTQTGVNGILNMDGESIKLSEDFRSIEENEFYIKREFIDIFTSKSSVPSLPGKNFISQEEENRVRNWVKYTDFYFLARSIYSYESLHFEDMYDTFNETFWFRFPNNKKFPYPIFIKSIRKGASAIIRKPEDFHEFCMGVMTNIGFIFSEAMDIAEDKHGKQEYRIYVVKWNPVNASRYVDYDLVNIPNEVFVFARGFSEYHKFHFTSYVLDIALCSDGRYRVVELNNLSASGRYRSNDFDKILNAVANIRK